MKKAFFFVTFFSRSPIWVCLWPANIECNESANDMRFVDFGFAGNASLPQLNYVGWFLALELVHFAKKRIALHIISQTI